jgi:cytochrome c-type biogenesis protein
LFLLTIAAAQGRTEYGIALALAFGIGRGLPFLLVGVFAGLLMRFAALARWRRLQMVTANVAIAGNGGRSGSPVWQLRKVI